MLKPSLVALSVGFLLSGCSTQAPEPVRSPVASRPAATAPAPTAAEEPAEELFSAEVLYTFNPVGKRDPFRNPLEGPFHACCLTPMPVACDGPLCGYSLEELKLSGVVSGMANPVAVIEGPQGKSYRVYRGSKLGRNGGVVKRVLRDSIVVAEAVPDGQGKVLEFETVLRVQRDLPVELGE
jgi:type IV pilus assembly protein PilP